MSTTPPVDRDLLDVIVIGAGQSGLALSYYLTRRHADVLILDAGPEIGHVWRSRWDSLRLFTPAQYDALPGMAFPAPAGTYPAKDAVADYLRAYAEQFQLPVRLYSPVTRVHREDGCFAVSTPTGTRGCRVRKAARTARQSAGVTPWRSARSAAA